MPGAAVNVVDVEWIDDVVSLTYRTLNGKVATELKFRSDEPGLKLVEAGTRWAFDSDGALFRLLSEARRIQHVRLSACVTATTHASSPIIASPAHSQKNSSIEKI